MGQPTKLPPPPPPLQPRRSGGGHGPTRRFLNHRTTRNTPPYSLPHHEKRKRESVICDIREVEKDEEAKLYVSNLHSEVSNSDIKVLFSDVGELKRFGIHYDRSGRSLGSAEVIFARKSDAIAAIERYSMSRLDGKLMYIELIGPDSIPPTMAPNVAQQQMPCLVPPTVSNWQMASARPSVVTYQQMAPPMPPPVAHWQLTPMPQMVPYWQMIPMQQAVPHWQRPGFIENPSYGFHEGKKFSQGQTPGKRHGFASAGDLDADMEKHAKWKRGGGNQRFSQGQKPQGKKHGKVSADDLDADLEKYISKRKENTL